MALRLDILLCAVLIFQKYRFSLADDANNTNLNENLTAVDKKALRYGFQNTHDCKDFEKAFMCVSKCLDLGYDASRADKNCKCTCFKKKDKAQYTVASPRNTTKKFTTPKTNLPIWAIPIGATLADEAKKLKGNAAGTQSDDDNVHDATAIGDNGQGVNKTTVQHDSNDSSSATPDVSKGDATPGPGNNVEAATSEKAATAGGVAAASGEAAAGGGEPAAAGEVADPGGEAPPASGEAAPASGEAAPASGEAAQASGEAAPASGEAAPASGEAAPASGEAAPASGEAAPASGEAAPASGEEAPASGEAAPASGEEAPASGEAAPGRL